MLVVLLILTWLNIVLQDTPVDGVYCRFKQQTLTLSHGIQPGQQRFRQRGGLSRFKLDTLSNWYNPGLHYVEIIRQDDPVNPHFGVALAFEFDEANGNYPYTPEFSKIQVKDFRWGGVEFGVQDTFNFTGVTNAVSDDLTIEVDGFQNDTIFGRFSGLLLSGAGTMASIDSGSFRALVYRTK